ncbi:hypothetical protein DMT42_13175 [Streptomyces actuosus]|uniref:Uncharacterized protein n=1 Tax=Streptomyces actuosus TaxID=1885 RepID=A0A2U9P0K7_STRAS|nr:hypothetical protein DMT42_13175 [Streptomyces actuosus]
MRCGGRWCRPGWVARPGADGAPLRPPVPPQRHDCPQLRQRGGLSHPQLSRPTALPTAPSPLRRSPAPVVSPPCHACPDGQEDC